MSTFYKLALVAVLTLLLAGSGFAQFSVFVVDDDGNPATTYPTLQQGLTTAAGFPGSAAIMIMPGAYSDANLTVPGNVIAIYGDSASAAGDIVFTAPLATDNFLAMAGGEYIANMTVVGYNFALFGDDVAGGTIESMMFDGNVRGVQLQGAGAGSDNWTVQGCTFTSNTSYGVAIGVNGSGNLVDDNCFIGNNAGGVQGYDSNGSNTWSNNFWDDYNSLLPYALDGGASAVDNTPQGYDNSVDGPATVEVLDEVTYDINWTVPVCAEGNPKYLAAYEFTVSYDPNVLSYVAADYDENYLGSVAAGALYTPIGVDNINGTLTFAATNFSEPGLGNGRLATVTFEAVSTGSDNLTIGSDYRDEANNPIAVQNTPLAVTVQDTEAPVIVSVAPNDPVGDDTYSEGSTAGSGPFVDLAVDVQATDNYDLDRIQYRFDDAGAWVNLVTGLSGTSGGTAGEVATSVYALVGEGAHVLNLRAWDGVNFSAEVDYDFFIDRTGPVLATIVLSDADGCAVDPNYTNDPAMTVDLTTADADVAQMEFYEAGWQGPIAFAATSTYTLLNTTDGLKTVYSRLYDVYGNMGNQLSDQITLDQVAPNPAAFVLAGGAAKTNVVAITADANFDNPNGTVEYNVSEDAADLVCGNGGWLTTLPAAPHPFPFTLSAGDGVKTVYFAVRDAAGNIGTVLSDDIELDATAPDLASITLSDPDGTVCSNSWTVDVTIEWTDTDVKYVYIKNDTAVAAVPTQIDISAETSPYTFAYAFTNPVRTPNAVNTVFAWLEDDATNVGATSTADIFVDVTNPSLSAMTIADLTSADVVFSNDDEVAVALTGSTDITEIRFSEDNVTFGPWIAVDFSGGTLNTTYTFASPVTENVPKTLYVEGQDCSGRMGAVSDGGLYFDLTDPVLSAMTINGGAPITNNPAVSVLLTITEVWQNGAATLTLSEDPACDPGDPTTVTFVAPGAGPWAFTLTSGDGTKTIYAQFEDRAENVSAIISASIDLDETDPTGSMDIVSTNPLALPGYTSTGAVTLENIVYDGDVTQMQIRNSETGGSALTAWLPAASSYSPWTLGFPGTTRHVEIRFRDAANNVGPWQVAAIDFNAAAPPPPAWASGTPGGSTQLVWGAVANAQAYQVRYNFSNEYPHYTSMAPPNPATMGAGIFEAQVADTTYDFDGPQPDMYAFTIWTLSNHGVWSASGNMDVVATNYILGDFYDSDADAMGPDGCIDFGDEFGELAIAYNSPPNAFYNQYLDIAPTFDGAPTSYPMPDLVVDFEDLIIFALNYDVHRCAKKNGFEFDLGGTRLLAGMIDMSATVPTRVNAGAEVVVPVMVSQPEVIKGFHVVLDYNETDFELVRVESGAAYETVEQSFFYYDQQSSDIDVSGVVFGADAAFTGDEMFRVVLRAKNAADVEMSDLELTFRDNQNQDIQAAFSTNPLLNGGLPTSFELVQNYPNPFNPSTTIEMALPTASDYTLTIYNVLGQQVDRFEGYAEAGYVVVNWDATNYSSGIYLYKMTAGTYEATKKMVLLK